MGDAYFLLTLQHYSFIKIIYSMNKFLRFSLLGLTAMFCGTMAAQEVTFDFTDNTTWNLPVDSKNKIIDTKSFSNGTYAVTLTGSSGNGYYYNSAGKYLMLGKSDATLVFPKFDFAVEKIEIVGTSTASTAIKQNIFVGSEAVSTETTGAKDVTNVYAINAAYQAAGNIYTLKVTSAHNTQITKIMIYKKSSVEAPVITGESIFEESTTLTITGAEGSTIYYTTDDTAPTVSSPNHGASPLVVSFTASATVKAIAVLDGSASNATTKKIEKVVFEPFDVAAISKMTSGKNYITAGFRNAKVTYVDDKTVYVREGENSVMVYDIGLQLPLGAVLNGSIKGAVKIFNSIPEIIAVAGFTSNEDLEIRESDVLAEPVEVTVADIKEKKYPCEYAVIKNVNIVSKDEKYYVVKNNADATSDSVMFYKGIEVKEYADNGKAYNVVGIFNAVYSKQPEFMPIEVTLYDDTINAIEEVKGEAMKGKDVIYNLAGQRLPQMQRGLNIVNGKKVIKN